MAFAFTNTNYAGKQFQELYTDHVIMNTSIKGMRLLPGNKGKMLIPSVTIGNVLQADSCTFNDSGTVTMDNKEVSVCDLKVNYTLCKQDLESQWISENMRAGANNIEMPATLEDFIAEITAKKIAAGVEELIWKGDTDLTGTTTNKLCDGLEKKFLADATVVDVTATTITTSTVLAELGKLYAAIPAEIQEDPNLVIFVSASIAKVYRQFLATQTAMFNWDITKAQSALSYVGIPVITAYGMTAGRMVATTSDNLWYSFDGEGDKETIEMLDQNAVGDDTIKVKNRIKHGVDYAYGKYVVLYS
jgi:hypothetical protein